MNDQPLLLVTDRSSDGHGSMLSIALIPKPAADHNGPMHSAAIHGETWLKFHRKPVTYGGVDCRLFVDATKKGKIEVLLIPEDEDEGQQWPVDVLQLSKAKQETILEQLTA